jgi:hypothetical protein
MSVCGRNSDRYFAHTVQIAIPGVLASGVKLQVREADHSPPTSVEVKKTWLYTSTPPYVFMAYCLVRDNFTFFALYTNKRVSCRYTVVLI